MNSYNFLRYSDTIQIGPSRTPNNLFDYQIFGSKESIKLKPSQPLTVVIPEFYRDPNGPEGLTFWFHNKRKAGSAQMSYQVIYKFYHPNSDQFGFIAEESDEFYVGNFFEDPRISGYPLFQVKKIDKKSTTTD